MHPARCTRSRRRRYRSRRKRSAPQSARPGESSVALCSLVCQAISFSLSDGRFRACRYTITVPAHPPAPAATPPPAPSTVGPVRDILDVVNAASGLVDADDTTVERLAHHPSLSPIRAPCAHPHLHSHLHTHTVRLSQSRIPTPTPTLQANPDRSGRPQHPSALRV
jgi:hypothetical protein